MSGRQSERPVGSSRTPVGYSLGRPHCPCHPGRHRTAGGASGPQRPDRRRHRGFSTSASASTRFALSKGPRLGPLLLRLGGMGSEKGVDESVHPLVIHHSSAPSFTQFDHPGVDLDSCFLSPPSCPIHQELLSPGLCTCVQSQTAFHSLRCPRCTPATSLFTAVASK